MNNEVPMYPDEVMEVHRSAQKAGFIAGVIFSVMAKYLYDRRQELRTMRKEASRRK